MTLKIKVQLLHSCKPDYCNDASHLYKNVFWFYISVKDPTAIKENTALGYPNNAFI